MDRRGFIKTCGFACVGGTTLAVLLQSCASTNYFAKNTLANNRITVKKSEFLAIEKEKQVQRKYVLVNIENSDFPICIFKLNDGTYSALLMQCTHRGCELKPEGDFVVCPCHGSEFTNMGIVQNPPAEENLKTFKTTADNENIYIQL